MLPRRRLLRAGALWGLGAAGTAGLLTGCGPVRLGQPARQPPPPPGIDELYRRDLITTLHRAIDACAGIPTDQLGDPELTEVLAQQRAAMDTGAEAEEASSAGTSDGADAPEPADAGDTAALMDALADLAVLGTQAARQTSSRLASPVSAIAARAGWAAGRLASVVGVPLAVQVPREQDITPAREVPVSDPPSTAATADLATLLGPVQKNELYAAYVREVLASRASEGSEQDRLMGLVDQHRDRAERLAEIADGVQGAEQVVQEPVAPLPSNIDDAVLTEQMLDLTLLEQHVQLVGAMAAEQRPLPIHATLLIGGQLVRTAAQLPPLPGLEMPAES